MFFILLIYNMQLRKRLKLFKIKINKIQKNSIFLKYIKQIMNYLYFPENFNFLVNVNITLAI